ncbi:hypothetical protein [Thermoanaerobacter sp. RKWS2]|uniref:hypothetical protein n=1 Tax=Thermoanaerobacter sp. RKWS2 TaxID=2983842 RepID=UPI00224AA0B5|nr:hypothetical protein [Thermoanaerobacter sp. RKWS2]UZQ81792.1 hypothetical protein OEI98_001530 [Thermoanaerobacter sp. RKWS2]
MDKNKFDEILKEVQELREKDKYFDALARAKAIAGIRYSKAFYDEDPEAVQYNKGVYDSIDRVLDAYYKSRYIDKEELTKEKIEALEEFIKMLKQRGFWHDFPIADAEEFSE